MANKIMDYWSKL